MMRALRISVSLANPGNFNVTVNFLRSQLRIVGLGSGTRSRRVSFGTEALVWVGLDSRKLEIPGRKRLDIDHGKPITEILG